MEPVELKGQYCQFVGAFAKIYTLSDTDGNVFYVGCTVLDLKNRVAGHINEAKTGKKCFNQRKALKIQELNYKIVVTVIDMLWVTSTALKHTRHKTKELEDKWILKYRELGYELTNRMPIDRGFKVKRKLNEFIGQSFMVTKENIQELDVKEPQDNTVQNS